MTPPLVKLHSPQMMGLGFSTGDLRGRDGTDGAAGAQGNFEAFWQIRVTDGSTPPVPTAPVGANLDGTETPPGWTLGTPTGTGGVVWLTSSVFNPTTGVFSAPTGVAEIGSATAGPQGPAGPMGTPGTDGMDGTDGTGWTGGSYDAATGEVTFTSTDGLGFMTGDLRGADGTNGTDGTDGEGWTGGSYDAASGEVTFTSTDGLGFSTGDLRGADGMDGDDGDGWTGGTYNAGTGVVTFTSTDGLGFSTGDLRGADGMNGAQGAQGVSEVRWFRRFATAPTAADNPTPPSGPTITIDSVPTGWSRTPPTTGTGALYFVLVSWNPATNAFGTPSGILEVSGEQGPIGPSGPTGPAGPAGTNGTDGTGWTSGTYDSSTGVVTFASDDGLGFMTGDLRGADGTDGTNGTDGTDGQGWTDGSYDSTTGIVTFESDDGLGFSTGDLRGSDGADGARGPRGATGATGPAGSNGTDGMDGQGWTGGAYNSSTGIVTFSSTDGLGFMTGDLRGPQGPAGSGATVHIEDEGTLLVDPATNINFVGDGVTATTDAVDAATKDIYIPGILWVSGNDYPIGRVVGLVSAGSLFFFRRENTAAGAADTDSPLVDTDWVDVTPASEDFDDEAARNAVVMDYVADAAYPESVFVRSPGTATTEGERLVYTRGAVAAGTHDTFVELLTLAQVDENPFGNNDTFAELFDFFEVENAFVETIGAIQVTFGPSVTAAIPDGTYVLNARTATGEHFVVQINDFSSGLTGGVHSITFTDAQSRVIVGERPDASGTTASRQLDRVVFSTLAEYRRYSGGEAAILLDEDGMPQFGQGFSVGAAGAVRALIGAEGQLSADQTAVINANPYTDADRLTDTATMEQITQIDSSNAGFSSEFDSGTLRLFDNRYDLHVGSVVAFELNQGAPPNLVTRELTGRIQTGLHIVQQANFTYDNSTGVVDITFVDADGDPDAATAGDFEVNDFLIIKGSGEASNLIVSVSEVTGAVVSAVADYYVTDVQENLLTPDQHVVVNDTFLTSDAYQVAELSDISGGVTFDPIAGNVVDAQVQGSRLRFREGTDPVQIDTESIILTPSTATTDVSIQAEVPGANPFIHYDVSEDQWALDHTGGSSDGYRIMTNDDFALNGDDEVTTIFVNGAARNIAGGMGGDTPATDNEHVNITFTATPRELTTPIATDTTVNFTATVTGVNGAMVSSVVLNSVRATGIPDANVTHTADALTGSITVPAGHTADITISGLLSYTWVDTFPDPDVTKQVRNHPVSTSIELDATWAYGFSDTAPTAITDLTAQGVFRSPETITGLTGDQGEFYIALPSGTGTPTVQDGVLFLTVTPVTGFTGYDLYSIPEAGTGSNITVEV